MRRIHLTVDQLVLKGFRPEERRAVAEGLKAGLESLLSGPQAASVLAGLGHIDRMNLGRMALKPGVRAAQVGAQTAKAIGGKLNLSPKGGRI